MLHCASSVRAPASTALCQSQPAHSRSFDDAQRTADWLDQQPIAIETALSYYAAHRAEIDEWIRRNEEAADAAERVARARQAAS